MRSHLAAVVLALAGLGVVSAQESVTLIMKSGERLPAQLMDLGGSGFTVQVGNEQRNINRNDVAVIDFGGAQAPMPAEAKDLGGRHLFQMRNGSIIRGEFVDIGGSRPLRLTVRTDSGNQDLSSADVRRIFLDRPPGRGGGSGEPPPPPPPTGGMNVRVDANQRWTPTNITVRSGQQVRFNVTGEIRLANGGEAYGPGGSNNRDPKSLLPNVPTGALIGRVDPGKSRIAAQPFVIGTLTTVTMPNDGMLQLGVNDSVVTDNSGTFTVNVNPQTPAPESQRRR